MLVLTFGQVKGEKVVERTVINPWAWQDQWGFVQANEVSGSQRTIYLAGQISVDAEGSPLHAGDMRAQIEQAMDNIQTVLREAGAELSNVVRLNYYTTDIDRCLEAWDALSARLSEAGCRPASTLLGVERLYHPDILIEIEATAVV